MTSLFLLLVSCTGALLALQPTPLPRAHAHNDYQHRRPLLDALERGFCSVEVDIHLVDGALLVAHDLEDVTPSRTLQALYLEPLRQRVRQGGRVYPYGPPLILLIDVKSEAEETYRELRRVLGQYSDLLTEFTATEKKEKAVTAILSGNRPRAMLEAEDIRYVAYDGRLEDLDSPQVSVTFLPLISSNWSKVSRWKGQGPMPLEDRRRLHELVATAHAQGRLIRFWGTPDNPVLWRRLYDAGVDLLNADDLAGLHDFLIQTLAEGG